MAQSFCTLYEKLASLKIALPQHLTLQKTTVHFYSLRISVADPGFPRGGGASPKGGGAPTYYLTNFCRKLHEMKKFCARGGARPSRPPLRSATVYSTTGGYVCTGLCLFTGGGEYLWPLLQVLSQGGGTQSLVPGPFWGRGTLVLSLVLTRGYLLVLSLILSQVLPGGSTLPVTRKGPE